MMILSLRTRGFLRLSTTLWLFLGAVIPLPAQLSLDREPPGPCTRKTGLVITEIFYGPKVNPARTNESPEFIEVYNAHAWAEDLGGFAIEATAFRYTFPSNTVLPSKGYLVLARQPGTVITNYGTNFTVVGPWPGATTNRLSPERDTVRLRNRQGAVLLEINYQDSPPWPEGADGTGHSLVLARPSYGEDDFRAWAQSDVVGGSPGRMDPMPVEPLASVVINEWQNHSDPDDWIELYNRSNTAVDLSGAWLSDDPSTNKYRIPNGTIIPARGFLSWTQTQLGFELFAGGETIFFWNAAQTRLLDVMDFRGQSNNITSGRYPDGGPITQGLANPTRGAANARPMRYAVVINEIMYNPISGNTDEEYVEIHNRSGQTVNLAAWEFVVGIGYMFPSNGPATAMPPGAHWVIARNPAALALIHTNLSTNVNLFGPYTGTLANGGERLTLAAADYDNVTGPGGSTIVERLPVPVSDLIYGDGGKWGFWSDGDGSSLELIDPEADVHHPSNWADSSDTGESLWTHVEWNGPIGETLGSQVNDRLLLYLQGVGECLIDEVEVRVNQGPNLVANGGFEDGLNGWTLQGSHDFSTLENEGFTGTKSLHLRAGSRGDNQSNRILSAPFASPIPADATNVSIRCKARWFRGLPDVLLRLHGSATEAYGRMALPRRLGSPGLPNSRRVSNAGPAIYDVLHQPILPAAGQPVVVTARAIDNNNPVTLTLKYRLDPTPTYTGVTMRDDGTGGDAVAGDGLFSATLPGQATGVMAAFYVEGRDGLNAAGTFPHNAFPAPGFDRCWPYDARVRECVLRWGEVQMAGDFPTYHLWVSAVNSNRWHTREVQNNTELDGTFVYNNARVIYNALPLYSGSPWHRTNALTGPAGVNRTDYEMNFPGDDAFLGSTDFVLNNPGNADILTVSDQSALGEQTVYRIFEGMGLIHNHRRYIHLFVNGSQRSTAWERPGNFIFEDSQQPNGDMIEQWFPADAGGQLFKVEDWFEFHDNGYDIAANNDADLTRRTVLVNGQPTLLPGAYRYMFRKRSVNVGSSANDYSPIFSLVNAVSPADNPTNPVVDPAVLAGTVDWEAWMRHFAVQRAVGNWDSYGWMRGKNDYLYQTAAGFVHMPWDIDYSLGLGRGPQEPLFESNDPRVLALFNTPEILRAYWRAFQELVSGPFTSAYLDPFIDSRMNALLDNDINIDPAAVDAIRAYIAARHAYLVTQLATVAVPFAIDGPPSFSTTNNLFLLTGTAPVEVKSLLINGAVYPVTWTSATAFQIRLVLASGPNSISLQGLDRSGNPLPAATATVTVDYTGPIPNPVGSLLITEILPNPLTNGAAFVEIINRSAQNFDLTGWRIDRLGLTFPPGSIVTNGQTLILAQNRAAFRAAFGPVPVFATFPFTPSPTAQIVALVQPTPAGDAWVDGVRYESAAPWPLIVPGQSFQVIDPSQENSRAANWAAAAPTPGAPNAVLGSLTPFDAVWINEVQIENLNGIVDNLGETNPWVELHNSGPTPINLGNYFLATNFTGSLADWNFPPGTVIAPGQHLVLWADGQVEQSTPTQLHTPFALAEDGRLALVRFTGGQLQIVDHLVWSGLGANTSQGGAPSGQSFNRFVLHQPTPGASNTEPPLRVFINEWMARNVNGIVDIADNSREPWFELHNAEDFTIDLGNYYLTDNASVPTRYRIPATGQYRIAPGGYLVVWADAEPAQNSPVRTNLHVNFSLGRTNGSGSIGLFAPDGVTPVDFITYTNQFNDVSEGRYADGATNRYLMSAATPSAPNGIPGYNSAPRFPVFGTLLTAPGRTNTLTIRVSDPDPSQFSTYAFVSPTPPGTNILNQGGLYRWIVPTNAALGDYQVAIRATDNGTPPRSATLNLTFRVQAPTLPVVITTNGPAIYALGAADGRFTLSFQAIAGRTYRVLYKNSLLETNWTQIDRDFVAGNVSASLTDTLSGPERYYRVLQVD
ncbi:MAG: hypothetical protein RJA22_746 [Verrucomicrobiota bacterium]